MNPELSADVEKQLTEAYWRMAAKAHYRPSAPSDGFGGITRPLEDLKIEAEARDYARRWWREEDEGGSFNIGLANFEARRAMVYAVEIARLCCDGREAMPFPLKLAQVLVEELQQLPSE